MAKKQPIYSGVFLLLLVCYVPIFCLLVFLFSILEAPFDPFVVFLLLITLVLFCIPMIYVVFDVRQKKKANKLLALTTATAELKPNISASLELNSHCKRCDGQRIVKGKLTDDDTIFLKSTDLKFYYRFWARSIADRIPKPLYEIEDLYFNYCLDCGHLGGFTSVEMLQLSLKAHATESALQRLNLVNDLAQE